jgi:hypothetical protein
MVFVAPTDTPEPTGTPVPPSSAEATCADIEVIESNSAEARAIAADFVNAQPPEITLIVDQVVWVGRIADWVRLSIGFTNADGPPIVMKRNADGVYEYVLGMWIGMSTDEMLAAAERDTTGLPRALLECP